MHIRGIILVSEIGYQPTSEVLLGVIQGAVGLCPYHVSHVSLVFQVLELVENILLTQLPLQVLDFLF